MYNVRFCRHAMKRRRSVYTLPPNTSARNVNMCVGRCSIVSARPRPPNWAWLGVVISGLGLLAHAKAYVTAKGGVARFCARLVEKCRRSKTVRCYFLSLNPIFFLKYSHALAFLAGLSDYEIRDLNDEINKLMREKRHWENQIIALGGANYRRNVAMLDSEGKEVPGTKGYKCGVCPLL
jgi:hypothetical protein